LCAIHYYVVCLVCSSFVILHCMFEVIIQTNVDGTLLEKKFLRVDEVDIIEQKTIILSYGGSNWKLMVSSLRKYSFGSNGSEYLSLLSAFELINVETHCFQYFVCWPSFIGLTFLGKDVAQRNHDLRDWVFSILSNLKNMSCLQNLLTFVHFTSIWKSRNFDYY
jgi:hypothetical protein